MARTSIVQVYAQEVYTDRNHPGVEAIVKTENGAVGRAVCTSGESIGTHEIRFSLDANRFRGKGCMTAVESVNRVIGPALLGMDASRQLDVDDVMLSMAPNAKERLGGNAVAAVSAAVLKAGAASLDIPLYQHIGGASAVTLPVPGVLMANGGNRYGGGLSATGGKPTYSVMLYGFDTFHDASYAGWEVQQCWYDLLRQRKGYDFKPNFKGGVYLTRGVFSSDEEIWALMNEAVQKAGVEGRCGLQADVASDTYYNREDGRYYGLFSDEPKTVEDLFRLYRKMADEYHFMILEDPFFEDDYANTAALTKELGIQIVGDDLFTTNARRVRRGIEEGAANTVLLKVNQIGSISESLEMVALAYRYGYGVMPNSSRGEGNAIADYAVGINAGTIRERAVYPVGNRFLEIERELGARARFWGLEGIRGSRFRTAAQR